MSRRSGAALAASPVLVGAVTVLVTIVAVFLSYNATSGLPFVPTYDLNANLPNAQQLVRGFEVRIGDSGQGQLPASLMQRLNLARGFIKRAPLMLLDEPGNGLDFQSDKLFMKRMEEMKGRTTCFIVTHRPSHLRIADMIVWLESGHLRAFGPAEKVQAQMPKDFV